jgi:hypothetical protein
VVQVKESGSSEQRRTTTSPKTNLRDEDDPNFRLSRPVVGDAYYDRKARVLCAEQKVLRAVDAEVNVPKIVSVFLNVARVVRAPKAVTKLALVVLTDTLYATASPSRLALGLFFGAPREEVSETTAVGDDGTQQKQKKTAVLAARAPFELAGDASAAAVRLAARLCGYALRRDDTGGAPKWTRVEVVAREDEKKRKRTSPGVDSSEIQTEIRTDDERSKAAAVHDLDPWWVEMEFDHARVERIERDALDVLTRGARRGVAFGASEAKTS